MYSVIERAGLVMCQDVSELDEANASFCQKQLAVQLYAATL